MNLPREHQPQRQFSDRNIEQEVVVLSRAAPAVPESSAEPHPPNGRAGALHVGQVETMNACITIANGGDDDTPRCSPCGASSSAHGTYAGAVDLSMVSMKSEP